jgi:uncharacterized protein with ATP-grasp and redox domains
VRVAPPCIQCIIGVRFREVMNAVRDRGRSIDLQIELLRIAHDAFRKYDELTIIASNVYSWLTSNAPEVIDYYRVLKRKGIDDAWRNIEVFRDYIGYFKGYEKFRIAAKISIAGNIFDTGVLGHKPPSMISVDTVLSTPLIIDHTREIYEFVKSGGRRILWLFDNAGEAVYDTILISVLRDMGNTVIGAVKEEPGFQNDLTIVDARYAHIGDYLDKLVTTGYSGSSIHLDKVSEEFRELLGSVDLVIAKGMDHYEYISTIDLGKPVVFLLIPKCDVVASALNTIRGYYVAYFRKR